MGDNFDIDFKLLPPRLQMQIWVLALDANTSRVNVAYSSRSFTTGIGYNYGGNVVASFSMRRVETTVGVNPSSGNIDLGLVVRGFRFGATGNVAQGSAGVSFGYGASLLPFPAELSSAFNSAAIGLQSMTGDIRSAPDNPLAWYGLHSNDVSAIGKAVSMGQRIAAAGTSSDIFGVGLRLNYTPQAGLVIYGGVQLTF